MDKANINTEGGAFVNGGVNVNGGDFVGRDKISVTEEVVYNVSGLPNPFRGLNAYRYDDKEAFAGREALVEEAVEMLTEVRRERTLLFITGASGSGKSSFAQAGLLPALKRFYAGLNLATTLTVFRPATYPIAMRDREMQRLGITNAARLQVPGRVNLIVVDQFEELFTQSDRPEREAFIDWLTTLPAFSESQTHIIATLRSDFLSELFNIKPLWDSAKKGIELRAMNVAELAAAIQKPLQNDYPMGEKRFEPALVQRLAEDAAGDATYLPLLQVTVEDLWRRGRLALSAYGKLADAITSRAECVFDFSDHAKAQPKTKRADIDKVRILDLFAALVSITDEEDVRRYASHSRRREHLTQGSAEWEALIDDLIGARLLSSSVEGDTQTGEDNVRRVRIIHESLIKNWRRLTEALDQRQKLMLMRTRFEVQLHDWRHASYDAGFLLSGGYLEQANELSRTNDVCVQSPEAQKFVRLSREADERARRTQLQHGQQARRRPLPPKPSLNTHFGLTAQQVEPPQLVDQPIERNQHYFQLQLSDGFFSEEHWVGCVPVIVSEIDLVYGGETIRAPFVRVLSPTVEAGANPVQATPSAPPRWLRKQVGKLGSYVQSIPLTPPCPYRGGDLTWSVSLWRISADEVATIEYLNTFMRTSTSPMLARQVSDSIHTILGTQSNADLIAGLQTTYEPNVVPLKSGYQALMDRPFPQFHQRLAIRDERLWYQDTAATDPVRLRLDYLLINVKQVLERTDWNILPFYSLVEDALQAAARPQPEYLNEAKHLLSVAYRQAVTSPDLTQFQSDALMDEWAKKVQYRHERAQKMASL